MDQCQACGIEYADGEYCPDCDAEIARIEERRYEIDRECMINAMDNQRYE